MDEFLPNVVGKKTAQKHLCQGQKGPSTNSAGGKVIEGDVMPSSLFNSFLPLSMVHTEKLELFGHFGMQASAPWVGAPEAMGGPHKCHGAIRGMISNEETLTDPI